MRRQADQALQSSLRAIANRIQRCEHRDIRGHHMESPFAIAAFCGARPYASVVGLEIRPFDSWRRRRWRQSSLLFHEAADVDSCCCPLILLAVPIDNASGEAAVKPAT